MSDANAPAVAPVAPAAPVTPAATTTSAAPVAPAPASPVAAPAAGGDVVIQPVAQPAADPEWLGKRIEQAKRNAEKEASAKLLKDLGVDSVDAAKARIAAAKAAEDASKTELQKATERVTALTPLAQRAEALAKVVGDRAALEMSSLTEAQRETVVGLAGDDPAAQLQTIDRLKKGGLLAAPAAPAAPAAAPAATAAPAPLPAPASSAPAAPGPVPTPPNVADIKTQYDRLVKQSEDPAADPDTRKSAAMAARAMAYTHRRSLFQPSPQK